MVSWGLLPPGLNGRSLSNFIMLVSSHSLCAMPCEYDVIERKLEMDSHGTMYGERHRYAQKKKYSAHTVILVLTGPKYFERRTTIRNTWLSNKPMDVINFFVIGTASLSQEELGTLEYEDSQHHDLLLLNHVNDSYYALTTKLMESFIWLDLNVNFKFVFKLDDDSYARLDILYAELQKKTAERIYWGFFDGRAKVKKRGTWAEHAFVLCDTYLPHARGGGYILSHDLVHFVVKNSRYLQKYNSEDVSLGAWLGPLEIGRIHDVRFDTEYVSRGCMNEYVVTHKQDVQQMKEKFENLKTTGKLCKKVYRSRYSYEYNWQVAPSLCCMRNDTRVP